MLIFNIGDIMKKILKNNSKLLLIISLLELLLGIYFLIYFNYMDRLNYIEASKLNTSNLTLLIQNMYTSTFWALIICMIILISIFTLTSIIYKKKHLHFISILIWCMLFILSLDFTKTFIFNLSNIAIFLPIILFNILAYNNQKKLIN